MNFAEALRRPTISLCSSLVLEQTDRACGADVEAPMLPDCWCSSRMKTVGMSVECAIPPTAVSTKLEHKFK